MAEELKALIEKIQEEGVKTAEEKARAIETEARAAAAKILEDAKREAAELTQKAKARIAKDEEASRASLKQAGRDLLIELRKEISAMLDRIITSHVHKALSAEEMAKLIAALAKDVSHKDGGIIVSMKKEDLDKIERAFLASLRDELKKGLTLKPRDDISAGFVISYDGGRSYYDFTDKALAKYISASLRPRLAEILNAGL